MMRRIRSSYWLQTKRTLARPAVRMMANSEEMFLTDGEALQAGPKSKRQRVAPVQRKPAAEPEASDEAKEFNTADEPLATPTSPGPTTTKPVQKKPAAKPMSDAADKAEESVRKKPAAKLTADASDDAEGSEFQTTDEEPLATAAPRSKAKPKPRGQRRRRRSRAAKQAPQRNRGATSSTLRMTRPLSPLLRAERPSPRPSKAKGSTQMRPLEMLQTSPKPAARSPTPIGSLSTS